MASISSSVNKTASGDGKSYPFAFSALTVLFFMWGFLTCLNDILIPHLKAIFELNFFQASLIQFTFFSAYFLMSIPAGKVIEKVGYKNGIVVGLVTASVGAFMFIPAAQLPSYGVFLFALFVLASGITVLQVAANPYVSILGPQESASARLNLSQAFNSLGTTVAPYFGGLLILSTAIYSADQIAAFSADQMLAYKLKEASSVIFPYTILGGALLVLGLIFAFLKLPSIAEVATGASTTFKDVLAVPHFRLGLLGIFVYVGAEVSIGSFLVNYFALPSKGSLAEVDAAALLSFYWGGAMVGRFVGSALMKFVNPAKMLGAFAVLAGLMVTTSMMSTGYVAIYLILAVGFFNSIMFPTIFTLSIAGLEEKTDKGSSLLVMSIVGGAILPALMGIFADNIGLLASFTLPILCYLYIAYFGFVGSEKKLSVG